MSPWDLLAEACDVLSEWGRGTPCKRIQFAKNGVCVDVGADPCRWCRTRSLEARIAQALADAEGVRGGHLVITVCVHGMPSPASCGDCMDEGAVAPPSKPERPVLVATFSAQYEGDCPGCLVPIRRGDRIGSWSDGRYRHADLGCEP